MVDKKRRELLQYGLLAFKRILQSGYVALLVFILLLFTVTPIWVIFQLDNPIVVFATIAAITISLVLLRKCFRKLLALYYLRSKHRGKMNVFIADVIVSTLIIAFASSRLTVAYIDGRLDNVVMWSILMGFVIYLLAKKVRQQQVKPSQR
ncbi:hypothetical protein [Pleionea sediminis]|uniref:hypothetical protein n=1 Tax=Pleionea sediminis TaxID=2569479 RepID=UPI0011859444|nr:hypothetical protein [Pleionea sediminis]